MDFITATKSTFYATRLVYWAVVNKLNICRQYRDAADPGSLEENRWKDLVIRSRWCTEFLGNSLAGDIDKGLSKLLSRIVEQTDGTKYLDIAPRRIVTPISFTAEPCSLCKSLEASFTPDDDQLRDTSRPWEERYRLITQALITDAFKIMGAGNYFYDAIASFRDTLTGNTPAGFPYSQVLAMWDTGIETSRRFLDTGKNCYSFTERVTFEKVNNLQPARRETIGIEIDNKYATTPGTTLKAVSGLYAINTELLCKTCQTLVEEDPIEVHIQG